MKYMKKLTAKNLFRTIRLTIGRYIAVLSIISLGVGFFTGLKSAQPSMQAIADTYFDTQNMYDFQLLSTFGFTQEDIHAFTKIDGIHGSEGSHQLNVLANTESGDTLTLQILSLPEQIALPKLTEGRMPQADNECVADSATFSSESIGTKINASDNNDLTILKQLAEKEYTIVGLVQSPRFISKSRNTTTIGSGANTGYIYIPESNFLSENYAEVLLTAETNTSVFSSTYDSLISEISPEVEKVLQERVSIHQNEWKDAMPTVSDESGNPSAYLLDLHSNIGIASFQNDATIVSGIANAFPVFFALVAALVCITTMTRMVNDERVQIGTLKALGYSNCEIFQKYIFYVGSAALIGCTGGFFLGTGLIPQIIWDVYSASYNISNLAYNFNPVMYICCLAVSILGSISVTILSCCNELKEKPANLIRPKIPQKGKRIFLERFTKAWMRLSFINKATVRNAFRYKKRLAMMLLGIGGCTALIVTGFGIRDSTTNIINNQYNEIQYYDAAVLYSPEKKPEQKIENCLSHKATQFVFAYQNNLSVVSQNNEKEATVIALPADESKIYFNLHSENTQIPYPKDNEAIISSKLADQLELNVGTTVTILFDEIDKQYTITGICDNYLNHYIYIALDSVPDHAQNTVYIRANNDEKMYEIISEIRSVDGVDNVSLKADERETMENSMSAMNYIVILMLFSAGTLAFLVLYNLSNINIIERTREVATVKVLGFSSKETASYILRENIILSVLGSLIGLLLGKLLHLYVISQIQVDAISFDTHISVWSYLISFTCTIIFTLTTNFIMRIKLEKINMTESLKSVE